MFYGIGNSETLFSPWSSPFRTLNLSVPDPVEAIRAELNSRGDGVVVKFKGPEDNGGKAIIGYSVYARYSDDNLKRSWHELSTHLQNEKGGAVAEKGGITSIVVRNIVPFSEVRLRISCHNELGESLLSTKSSEPLQLLRHGKYLNDGGLLLDSGRELIETPACYPPKSRSLDVWSAKHLSFDGSISSSKVFIDETLKLNCPVVSDLKSTCVKPVTSPGGAIAIIPRSQEPIVATALRLQVKCSHFVVNGCDNQWFVS